QHLEVRRRRAIRDACQGSEALWHRRLGPLPNGRRDAHPRVRAQSALAAAERAREHGHAGGPDRPLSLARRGRRHGAGCHSRQRAVRDHARRGTGAAAATRRAAGARHHEPSPLIDAAWVGGSIALVRLAERLSAAPEVALDTEGDSLHHSPERLSLLQLAAPDGAVWLVDPLAIADLTPLAPVFADVSPVLVVHAG